MDIAPFISVGGSDHPVLSKQIGAYYTSPTLPTGGWGTGSGDALGVMVLVPLLLEAGTLDRLAQQHFSVAAAGELMRLGLYSDNGSGFPGALLLDAGTIDLSTAASIKGPLINQVITRGLYWGASVRQGSGVTAQLLINQQTLSPPKALLPNGPVGSPNLYDGGMAWVQAGVNGALPANYTGNAQGGVGNSAPVFVRYSA